MVEITRSLRSRLAGWLLLGATLLGTSLLVDAWINAHAEANRDYDAQLRAAALTIADGIRWRDDQPVVSIPAAALRILAGEHQERVFYSVFTQDGRRLAGNLALPIKPAWQKSARQSSVYLDTSFENVSWRLHGQSFELAGWSSNESLQIWVGHTNAGRRTLANHLFMPALIRFIVFLMGAALFGGLAIRSALRPLHRLRDQLRTRAADDVTPLSARVPGELSELAKTLDDLLTRQRNARAQLLRFVADASHQLKTPLAGLQNASELALKESHPAAWHRALQQIHGSADRTSRLARQLLNFTRLRHVPSSPPASIDLVALAADCTREWADAPSAFRHDLGFAAFDRATGPVKGEAWALRELIGNLIDNALRYTPAGCAITVGVRRRGQNVELSVEDDGPGVDEALIARLGQPFERAGRTDEYGSGLGLAIVRSVIDRHQGRLHISNRDGGGLLVSVCLPMSGQPPERTS
ncbi:sensor histidine kinase [Salinisphaera hydrothermalis]|uniref:sensor histidine kinase n=1 Tax=Salinisphaera hydrothermalis TaxID=563188 RepID=UPI0033402C99